MNRLRCFVRPLGHLTFATAVLMLSATGWLLGERDDLGFFASRLARTIRRYPEVTHRGFQVAWLVAAFTIGFALSPLDPLAM